MLRAVIISAVHHGTGDEGLADYVRELRATRIIRPFPGIQC